MADNYIEKKMEELRERRAGGRSSSSGTTHINMLNYPFRKLRVLFLCGEYHHISDYISHFKHLKCQTAVISGIPATQTDLPENHGCRYFVALTKSDTEKAFLQTSKAWRDIDLIVTLDFPTLLTLRTIIEDHTKDLPYPNDWGMPILIVSEGKINRVNTISEINNFTVCTREDSLPATSSHTGRNHILPHSDVPSPKEAHLLPFAALRSNATLSMLILS